MLGLLALCHMLYLCMCILYLHVWHMGILEQSSFQKYTTCWVFLELRHMLYLCFCVFVFVYLCMRHLVISVFISLDQGLSENVWFVWSKTSYSGDVTMRDRRTDDKQTREDKATQRLDAGRLSFAKSWNIVRGTTYPEHWVYDLNLYSFQLKI